MRARVGPTIGAGYDLVRPCRGSGRWTALSLLFTLRQGLRRRNLYSYLYLFDVKQRSILRPIIIILYASLRSFFFSFSFPFDISPSPFQSSRFKVEKKKKKKEEEKGLDPHPSLKKVGNVKEFVSKVTVKCSNNVYYSIDRSFLFPIIINWNRSNFKKFD